MLRFGGYLLGVLLSILSVSLLIRHLGIPEYGHYTVVIALVATVQGVTDVGLGQIGVREFAVRHGRRRERLMRNLLGLRIALTSVGVAVAVAFAAIAGYGEQLVLGTLVAGVAMVLTVIQGTFVVPLAAELRLGWATAMDLLRQVLSVLAIVVLVAVGARLLAFLSLTVPVSILVLAATLGLVRRAMPLRPSFERGEWTRLTRVVLPFAASVAIGTLYLRSTIILMPLLTNKYQTGYYSTSYNVITVLIAIPALTVGGALPILARAARDDSERLVYVLGRLFEVTLIVGVWLALALVLGAGFVVAVLSGGSAQPAIPVIQIQALAIVTQFVGAGWLYGLISLHVYRPMMWIAAGALVLNVLLAVILVPPLGARGGAIAFALAETTAILASLAALVHVRRSLMPPLRIFVRVLPAAALAGAVALLPGLTSLEHCVIASGVYLAVLLALRAIPPEIVQALTRPPRAAHRG
jgi:O-antigen/teichoic acid export membrane protein